MKGNYNSTFPSQNNVMSLERAVLLSIFPFGLGWVLFLTPLFWVLLPLSLQPAHITELIPEPVNFSPED